MKRALTLVAVFAICAAFVSCTPPEAKDEKADKEVKAGLENGEFNFDNQGRNIHYRIHGQGPVIMVLTNAWGITTDGLRNLFKCLESDFTMVYFDSRGMGGSSPVEVPEDMGVKAVREDYEALRKHLELEKVVLLGWSNGAMSAPYFLTEYPDSVSKAIIVHGAFYTDPADAERYAKDYPEIWQEFGNYMQMVNLPETTEEAKEQGNRDLIYNIFLPALFKDSEAGVAKIKELFAETTFSYKHNIYSQTVDMTGFDSRELLPGIKTPVLLIAGAYDMNPPERIKAAAEKFPEATYVLFEESGHFSMVEETEKFVKVIKEFLAK